MDQQKNRRDKKAKQSHISSTLPENSQEKEEKIQKEFEKTCDLGMDISTATIGLCLLESDSGNLVSLSNIKLNSTKFKSLWEKADEAERQLLELKKNNPSWAFKRIFVEENAKRFAPGFSSADTILSLAKMNGIVSWMSRKILNAELYDVNVVSARSKLGIKIDRKNKILTTKEKVRLQVVQLYPELPLKKHLAKTGKNKGQLVFDKECEDEIDAFVIAMGGRIINAQ